MPPDEPTVGSVLGEAVTRYGIKAPFTGMAWRWIALREYREYRMMMIQMPELWRSAKLVEITVPATGREMNS